MSIKNKKFLIVNTYFSPVGGAEQIAYNTFRLLKNNGFDVYFWSCNKKPYFDECYEYQKYFTDYNINLKNYFLWYFNKNAEHDLQVFINKIKPDIIHLHGFVSYLSPSVLNCCKNIPTIATLHDSTLACPAVKMLYKNKVLCKDIKCKNGNYINCLLNNCANNLESSVRKTIRAYITKSKLKYIDNYITPSNTLKQIILNSNIGITEKQIVTINNFLIVDELNIKPNYNNNGYFLYAGRISKEKGVKYLLQAMKDLPKEIELHIVGKGNEEENLKKYVKENNLDNVKFLGFKNREEIKEEYQNCIATILPCNWFENFPTTNMESFINGKPVIASNIGGIPEQVEHNKTGLLFEPANIEQLKECIMKYWNNQDLVIEHGKNAYQKAATLYTEKRYLSELLKEYSNLLDMSGEFVNV